MKRTVVLLSVSVFLLVGLGEAIVLRQARVDPVSLASLLAALALTLCAFVGLVSREFVARLRAWAGHSVWTAAGIPLLLLIPYLVFALGTGTFSLRPALRLALYVVAPTLLLLPDRSREAQRIGWRDVVAMLALAVPVAGNWLEGIWTWPEDLYFFRPLYSVCAGGYAFMAVRKLEGVGYTILIGIKDALHGVGNFAAFSLLALPLGLALGFIHPHKNAVGVGHFVFQFVGIFTTIALPEEFLFRGILQNFLIKTFAGARRTVFGILVASLVFGAAHLHHAPVPNWRYAILASLAGIFYGNAYRGSQRLSASALTHALVDTVWHFWF